MIVGMSTGTGRFSFFDIQALAGQFPGTAETMLLDRYLADTPEVSTRIFRVYRPTPAHFHRHCDEHLYVVSGRGTFWAGEPGNMVEFRPGMLLVFERNTVHAMPAMLEGPVVFLAMDTPRRHPPAVHLVAPADGTAEGVIPRPT